MMRIPSKPPHDDWISAEPYRMAEFVKCVTAPEVRVLIDKANHEYVHWDRLRHWPLPDTVPTHDYLWAAVALARRQQFQELPIRLPGGLSLRYWTPPQHQEWLHRIDQDTGGLIGSRTRAVPKESQERFLFNALMEEAIASSQIEGASTTRQIAKSMLRTRRRPRTRHEQMILNNYNAILEIRGFRDDQLSPEMLCRIQEVITAKTLDDPTASGRFKNADDDPNYVVDTQTDEILHLPPDWRATPELIEQLCDFANAKQKTFIHPVVKAIALHFLLGYIHPFVDGNGRTARAVFYWYMLRTGYWIFEFLPLSRLILDSMVSYGKAYLYTETDSFDLTYFLHYHLRIIDRSVQEMHEYFTQQMTLMREAREAVNSIADLNHRQVAVAQDAIQNPDAVFTIRDHAAIHAVTKATARADLFGLEECGLLQKKRDGKQWAFQPALHLKKRLQKGVFQRMGRGDQSPADVENVPPVLPGDYDCDIVPPDVLLSSPDEPNRRLDETDE